MRACKHVVLAVLVVGGAWSCKGASSEPEAPAAAPAELSQGTPPAAEPTPAVDQNLPFPTKPSPDAVGYPKAGWTKIISQDEVPLCVFSSYTEHEKAKLIEQVSPQKLVAKEPAFVGAYAPGCVNEQCDDLPSLQCWVDRGEDEHTLVVHSKYVRYHKDGSTCGDNCRTVTAACPTPALAAGKYTIKHGSQTFSLKIPSQLKDPCFH
ncbi:MAG: hypothetical protein ABW321_13620 [Polyangiales bacterium]